MHGDLQEAWSYTCRYQKSAAPTRFCRKRKSTAMAGRDPDMRAFVYSPHLNDGKLMLVLGIGCRIVRGSGRPSAAVPLQSGMTPLINGCVVPAVLLRPGVPMSRLPITPAKKMSRTDSGILS